MAVASATAASGHVEHRATSIATAKPSPATSARISIVIRKASIATPGNVADQA